MPRWSTRSTCSAPLLPSATLDDPPKPASTASRLTTAPFPPGFDRADWKAPPHTAWALRNVARFLPVATVPRGGEVRPLDTAPARLNLDRYLETVHATSAMIVSAGRIVFEAYRQSAGAADRPMLFSITKSLLGLIALDLIADGAIDPGRTAADYVPEFAGTAFGGAQLADLLAMRDGVTFDEGYGDPDAEIHRYSRHYWGDAPGGTLAALQALPARAAARARFGYRTPVADVIAWVLRRATGKPLAQLMSERLWAPLGAEADALMIQDTAGHEIGGTGFCARPRDLARLALALMAGGDGAIRPEVVEAVFAGGDARAFAEAGYSTRTGWSYAGLWWHMGGARIAALGVHGQRLMIDREAQLALIVTAAAPSPDSRPLDPYHQALFENLAGPGL